MAEDTNTIRIRVNGSIPYYAVGEIVKVPADMYGTPLDLHWRRRLKDAVTDKCCEVVTDPQSNLDTETSWDREFVDDSPDTKSDTSEG